MIDRAAREQLALRLRRLASGRLSTARFDDARVLDARDEALIALPDAGWGLYDDCLSYRLRGRHALSREVRAAIGRCVLFLKCGLPYEWPPLRPSIGQLLFSLLTLGRSMRRRRRVWEAQGAYAVWPFFRKRDYRAALANPPFLTGVRAGRAA